MENFELVKWANGNVHVAQSTVEEFETVVQSFPAISTIFSSSSYQRKVINKLLKTVFLRSSISSSFIPPLIRSPKRGFSILMGNEYEKCLFDFFLKRENAAYFFDAWPSCHREIERFIKNFNVKSVFFSSKKVTEIFQGKHIDCRFYWIPEAIDVQAYRYEPFARKDIDVLQFGRKYDYYHSRIVNELRSKGYSYLYEKVKGEIVFPTQSDFLNGLARSKVSICFPSSLTHPMRSGDISTMTVRYLQSMASKCLIVGVIPDEMIELFDYMPIIEVDFSDPEGQLLSVLENYDRYIPLIEKNYNTVASCHTWECRSHKIMELLSM